jgi:antitoxin PrlF
MTSVTATVTSKGQITIPKAIREALGIGERTELLFVLEGDSARLVPIGGRSLVELGGSLPPLREWPGMASAREIYRQERAERLARGGE